MTRFRSKVYSDTEGGSPTEQEERVAQKTGGKRVSGSGASMYSKGDVRDVRLGDVDFLIECKQTKYASLSVKWDWLTKISSEAITAQSEPALSIEIKGGADDNSTDRDWIMIPLRVFERMRNQ